MATRHRDFKLRYIIEDVTADTAWHPEAVLHDVGRLSADNLRDLVPDFAERTVFCAAQSLICRRSKRF